MLENASVEQTLMFFFIIITYSIILYILIKQRRLGLTVAGVLAIVNIIAVYMLKTIINLDPSLDALVWGYSLLSSIAIILKTR